MIDFIEECFLVSPVEVSKLITHSSRMEGKTTSRLGGAGQPVQCPLLNVYLCVLYNVSSRCSHPRER